MNAVFSKFLDRKEQKSAFPLISDDEILISFSIQAECVILKGDFDAWTDGIEMEGGDGFWWAVLPFDAESGLAYKFLVGDDWYCDPHNPYISFGPEAYNSCIPRRGKGGIIHLQALYSPELENERDIFVYVPHDHLDTPSLPILYAQDGYNLFSNPQAPFGNWALDQTLDILIEKGLLPPLLVVAIDTPDRMNEYSWSAFPHEPPVVPRLEQYAIFMRETLHPLITEKWRCSTDVAILGGSLGGSSALWLAWHHADFFSRVAAFSGSFWMEDPSMMEIIASTQNQPDIKIYLDSGDSDREGTVRFDADNLNFVDCVHDALCAQGWNSASPVGIDLDSDRLQQWDEEQEIPSEKVCMIVGKGHQHREEDWAKRVGWALRFLYTDLLENP